MIAQLNDQVALDCVADVPRVMGEFGGQTLRQAKLVVEWRMRVLWVEQHGSIAREKWLQCLFVDGEIDSYDVFVSRLGTRTRTGQG